MILCLKFKDNTFFRSETGDLGESHLSSPEEVWTLGKRTFPGKSWARQA